MITINDGCRETTAYIQDCECDICDEPGRECLLIFPPPPWSGVNICRECWDKLSTLWNSVEEGG